MNFPLLTIAALAGELNERLAGRIISAVDPLPQSAGLCLRATRTSQASSLCLTTRRDLFVAFICTAPDHHTENSHLANNLRRLLLGHTIVSIRQWRHDRIILMELHRADEIHGTLRRALILELVPRRQNAILLDQDSQQVLAVFRRVSGQMSRIRRVLPGHPYQPPPWPPGLHPEGNSAEEFIAAMQSEPEATLGEALTAIFPWATPYLWDELCRKSDMEIQTPVLELKGPQLAIIWEQLSSWAVALQKGPQQATLILDHSNHQHLLLPYDPQSVPPERKRSMASLSEALEWVFTQRLETWKYEWKKRALAASLQRALHRHRRTLKHLQRDLSVSQRAEEFKKFGEVIAANMTQLKRGMSQIRLPDPYSAGRRTVLVPLDSRLSPAENAQRYFKRFRKAKSGLPKIEERLQWVRRVVEDLKNQRESLKHASDERTFEAIKVKLGQLGAPLPHSLSAAKVRKSSATARPLSITLEGGWTVLVGRNNRENDLLTHRLAKSDDLWFHAQGVPGSHVILRRGGRKDMPNKKRLEEAASLAAHFSRARHSSTVPVIYTEKRYVRKPRGAKPGLAVVEREKTLFVKPLPPKRVTAEEEK